ncbi:MAG TPA: hypothetical protein VHL05_12430 [Terriglobales bacterium]|jgi:hypothetical protein|nr:hypothetical protein [Terriglobales bacterium]
MRYLLLLILLFSVGCEAPRTEEEMHDEFKVILDDRARPVRPAFVLEPQIGPWNNSPRWGSGYNGAMPDTAGVELPVFDLSQTFGPPKVHSIALFSSTNIGATNADVRAHVRWGAGAVQNEFYADWFNGAQFSLVADHIRITAVTWTPGRGSYDPANGAIQLTACAAQGSVQTRYPLTYTEQALELAAAGGTVNYNIPPLAKAVIVHATANDDPATPFAITATLATAGGSSISHDIQIFASGNPLVIPGGMNILSLLNTQPGPSPAPLQVQWILGL